MPEVQGPPEVTREVLSRLDTLSAKLASVSSLLEARFAQAQYTARNLQLPSNATEPFPLPKGTGGLILVPPPNQDLAGLVIEVGGMYFTFEVGSVTPAFIACPGVSTSATLTNTTGATIPLRLITVGPEYAAMYTQAFGISITGSRGSGSTVPLYVSLTGNNVPFPAGTAPWDTAPPVSLAGSTATIGSLALPAVVGGTYSLTTINAGPFYNYVSAAFSGADPSKVVRHTFGVENGTDQSVTVSFFPDANAQGSGAAGQPDAAQLVVPASDAFSIGPAASQDFTAPWLDWLVSIQFAAAPSSGTLTIKYRGTAM